MARSVRSRPSINQFLGNSNTREVHYLKNEKGQCQIGEILRAGHAVVFLPDTVQQAHREDFDDCGHCIGRSPR
jgi:hypothetical protein